jgi:hypothetical protein
MWLGEESRTPAIAFRIGSVTVVGVQAMYGYGDSVNPSVPADMWHVTGREARLPLGLTLGSTLHALRAAYGRGIAHNESTIVVVFCRYPRLWFTLGASPNIEGGFTDDLSSLPDAAHVEAVWVHAGSFVKTRWGAGMAHTASC